MNLFQIFLMYFLYIVILTAEKFKYVIYTSIMTLVKYNNNRFIDNNICIEIGAKPDNITNYIIIDIHGFQ